MPTQLQIRRGTSTEHNSFTGAAGELTVDTTKDTVVVHDGSTAGGFPLARANGSNLSGNLDVGTVTADGLTVDGTTNLDATNIVGALDVTGTATMDGLTVDGDAVFTTGDTIRLNTSDGSDNGVLAVSGGGANSDARGAKVRFYGNEHASLGGALNLAAGNVTSGHIYNYTNAKLRQRIDYNGDISFFEDTGTTAKLHWDASAESLGIGTSSPAMLLDLDASSASSNDIARFSGKNSAGLTFRNATSNEFILHTATSDALVFGTNGNNERLRIDSSGAATFSSSLTVNGVLTKIGGGTSSQTVGLVIDHGSSAAYSLIQAENDNGTWFSVAGDGKATFGGKIEVAGDIVTKTAGTSNVRLGVNAGNSIVSGGNQNTVVGDEAGTAISTGDGNVAVGYGAFKTSNTGYHTVAIGVNAGDAIISAGQNVLIGYDSGTTLTTGGDNTAVGDRSFKLATTGTTNTAVGGTALENTSTGSANVAVGWGSLRANGTGSNNTAVGMGAGGSSTGTNNTFVGGLAGDAAETVSYSSLFGQDIACGDTSSNECNGFGYAITAASGYTTIGIGTYDIRAAHGNVTWATVSDERYKKDIVDSEAGLSLINALRPRTFKYKTLGELPETFNAFEADSTEVFKNSNTNHGFIAQEVKAAIDADDSIKDGFRLWDDRDDGSQEVAEAALIPVLVKAIQELTARIETLEG